MFVMINAIDICNNKNLLFVEKDPCDPNPCKNEAQCVPTGDGSYNCVCPAGFKGLDCSRKSPNFIPMIFSDIYIKDGFLH